VSREGEKIQSNELFATNTFEDHAEKKAEVGHGDVSFIGGFSDIKEETDKIIRITKTQCSEETNERERDERKRREGSSP
jgi:hypothetical protein